MNNRKNLANDLFHLIDGDLIDEIFLQCTRMETLPNIRNWYNFHFYFHITCVINTPVINTPVIKKVIISFCVIINVYSEFHLRIMVNNWYYVTSVICWHHPTFCQNFQFFDRPNTGVSQTSRFINVYGV